MGNEVRGKSARVITAHPAKLKSAPIREGSIHGLEQEIEEQRQNYVTAGSDEICGIAIGNKLAAHQDLREDRRQTVKQVDRTGGPGPGMRRCLPNPFHHCLSS